MPNSLVVWLIGCTTQDMTGCIPIPVFKSEAEERAFWESHDSTDYVDWSKAKSVRFPNLKPSTKAIRERTRGW